MKITFLGTNGWFDTSTGNTICTLIETREFYLILDAGLGIQHLDKYVKDDKPVYLFLSHLHFDHIYGLHILPMFKFLKKLEIYTQPGTKEVLEKIISHPFMMPIEEMKYSVEIKEYSEENNLRPFQFKTGRLLHIDACFGFRFIIEDKTIVHCLDTGLDEKAVAISKNADILITECSMPSGKSVGKWGHLNPQDAGNLALQAQVKKAYLTHFSCTHFLNDQDRIAARDTARKIFPEIYNAADGLTVEI
jgi:ribonuclease BN (tRNA processing enzyme)